MRAADALLLAIESATSRLSVALEHADGRVVERVPPHPGHHAEAILPLVDAVLREAGCGPGDPDAFAVSIGPGSFTSLRVGLATAKGLAFATGRPIVPVPTLEALAFGALAPGDDDPIGALLDARRGELYAAVFEPEGEGLRCVLPDGLFAPEALAAWLPARCRLVGDGVSLVIPALGGRAGQGVRVEDPDDLGLAWPRATSVARLARARLARGETGGDDLAPRYLRRAEAEAKRTARAVEDEH